MTPTQALRPELASMFAPRSIALVGVSERSLWSTLILDGLGLMGLADPLPPELADLARLGAAGCPERAIAVSD
jgi:hypothetical protein